MRILRQRTPSSAVLMGASVPQIFWYTERDVVDFPDESEFPASLAQCDWVIVTNFERGQKPYARNLTAKVTRQDVEEGSAAVFQSGQFSTVLIRSALLRERP
jgi:hypothetical protein